MADGRMESVVGVLAGDYACSLAWTARATTQKRSSSVLYLCLRMGFVARAWLESGVEDDGTKMLFVAVRRSLSRIAVDAGLLAEVARRLQAEEAAGGRVEKLVADSQYSSRRFRGKVADCGVMAVIPYPLKQRRGEDVLRADRYFRVHGSEEERRLYGWGMSSIERVNSSLEEQVCLDRHRVRGLRNIAVHVALCIIAMLLVAVAALRLGVPWKARSIATFGW